MTKKKKIQQPQGINLSQLSELAKNNPRYAKMFAGLAQIDGYIKNLVEDIILSNTDASKFYVKTELMSQCYTLYLFNTERQATVGISWPLVDFLCKCEDKTIDKDIHGKVQKMLGKFDNKGLSTGDKINWVY